MILTRLYLLLLHTYIHTYLLSRYLLACMHVIVRGEPPKKLEKLDRLRYETKQPFFASAGET